MSQPTGNNFKPRGQQSAEPNDVKTLTFCDDIPEIDFIKRQRNENLPEHQVKA